MGSVFNPWIVGVVGGLGMALGEITGYMIGYSGQTLVDDVHGVVEDLLGDGFFAAMHDAVDELRREEALWLTVDDIDLNAGNDVAQNANITSQGGSISVDAAAAAIVMTSGTITSTNDFADDCVQALSCRRDQLRQRRRQHADAHVGRVIE
jgi:hypothetical protein